MSKPVNYKARDYDFGLLLQSLRHKTGLKQVTLAELVGVSEKSIQNWEGGVTYPNAKALQKMIETFIEHRAFTVGEELNEAESLWENVRLEAPRLNVLFDRERFRSFIENNPSNNQIVAPPQNFNAPTSHNLPRRLTSFIGRHEEQAFLLGWLVPNNPPENSAYPLRLLTLSGAGGVGKTSLALELGWKLLEHYPDGVWLVELASLQESGQIIQQLAQTLGLREQKTNRPVLDESINHLKHRQILLILDNCEHLINECAILVERLLLECPAIRLLATSREVFNIQGEQVYYLPSLAFPAVQAEAAEVLQKVADYTALTLFSERAKATHHLFELTAENIALVCQICRYLDGIPLAIELAAARVRFLTVAQIANRLNQVFDLLSAGSRTAIPRQQTLKATIEWSYNLLTDQEQILFRRLSVFSGGFTLEVAETVCSDARLSSAETFEILGKLIDKSLVVAPPRLSGGLKTGRYHLLETIRQFGLEELAQVGETEYIQERHARTYLALAEATGLILTGNRQLEALQRLEVEYPNLRAALDWSMQIEQANAEAPQKVLIGLACGNMLNRFWEIRGYFNEAQEILGRLQNLAKTLGVTATDHYAWLLNYQGRLAYLQGYYPQARFALEESLYLFERLEAKLGIAEVFNNLGFMAENQADYENATTFYEKSLLIRRELGDQNRLAANLNNLGNLAARQGDYKRAVRHHEEALAIYQAIGDKWGIGVSFNSLGNVAENQADYNAANRYYRDSLFVRREIGNKQGIANSLNNLGLVANTQGKYHIAHRYHQESLLIKREINDKTGIANSLNNLGNVAASQADYKVATAYHLESLSIRREIGNKRGIAYNFIALANIALQEGLATPDQNLSHLLLQRTVRLSGAVASLIESTGDVLAPSERSLLEKTLSSARKRLGENAYEPAFEEGFIMSLEQGLDFALQESLLIN
jgi:predicted ATPase/transcriptional regulator with XRE-family HTH domain